MNKAGKQLFLINNSAKKEMRQTKALGENINYNNASAAKVKMNSDSKYNRSEIKEPSLPKLNLIVSVFRINML